MPKINQLPRAQTLAGTDLLAKENTSGTSTEGVSASQIADYVKSTEPTLDTTLTQEGHPADAKAVGDALANKQNELTFDANPTAGSQNPVTSGGIKTALDTKQNNLTFDDAPTAGSNNPVKSKGIKSALDTKQNNLTFDSTPTANSSNPVTSAGIKTALDTKQNTLTFDNVPTNGSNNPVKSDGVFDADEAIRGSVTELKNAIYDAYKVVYTPTSVYTVSNWAKNNRINPTTGANNNNQNGYCRSTYIKFNFPMLFKISSGYTICIWVYSGQSGSSALYAPEENYNSTEIFLPKLSGAAYYRISICKTAGVALTDDEMATAISELTIYKTVDDKYDNYFALNSSDAITINATSENPVDYDDYKTPGSYVAKTSNTVDHITNKPPTSALHRLFVISTSSSDRVAQIVITNAISPAVQIYKRMWNGSTWTSWNQVVDTQNIVPIVDELNENIRKGFVNNTRSYYTLDAEDYQVGVIDSEGEYVSTRYYRISTPDIHIAETDLLIRPKTGYRLFLYLFSNGEYTERLSPGIEGVKINAGQEYKISIRLANEDQSVVVTVADLYDKAMFFNPIQQINDISKTGEACYNPADFGLIPQAVFYPGTDDLYNDFGITSGEVPNTTTQAIYDAFDTLVAETYAPNADSQYITKSDLGLCSDGTQHVYAYTFAPKQIGNAVFIDNIPTIFMLCGQHGFEKASVFSLYYLFKHMVEDLDSNPILNYLRNHCKFICVPVANPWGFDNNQYKNYNGVNLNRNWDANWEYLDDTTSKDYAGLAPFDQPETLAISELFTANKNSIIFAVDYHTNGKTLKTNYATMNAVLIDSGMDSLTNVFKNAIRYHVRDITSHFKTQFSLNITDDVFCGYIDTEENHPGMARTWFTAQNKVACSFETFPGFSGYDNFALYAPDVIKASEELISNFIITVFNYLK